MMRILALAALFLFSTTVSAQITMNGQAVYGNEWIDQTLPHIEIKVVEEGMYKITFDDLVANGFPAAQINGNDLQMFSMGRQVALYNTTEGAWNSSDYMVFHGDKQKGELDAYLFGDPETQQLNPEYSMFADERTYFLRLKPNANFSARYETVENTLGSNLPLKEKYYMEKTMQVYNDFTVSPGTPTSDFVHFSHFITMEGFSSTQSRETLVDFPVVDFYNGADAPLPSITLRTGSNNVNHIVQLSFNNSLFASDGYTGAVVRQYEESIDRNNIRNNNNNRLKVKAFGTADNVSVAYSELCYPREYDAKGNKQVGFYTGTTNFSQYIEYPNMDATQPMVFDVENNIFTTAEMDGRTAKFLLPPAAIKQSRCYIVDAAAISPPLTMQPANFVDIDNINPEYLILTSEVLNQVEDGVNQIEEYVKFRESTLGGGYKVEVINVEQIYDQFGFGINEHSLAIRNFAQYVKTKWIDFELVFIIGKALTFPNKTKNLQVKNIVPTFGRPGSDNLLFADNEKTYPYIGVGRLAAQNAEDISKYLEKARINAMLNDVANLPIEDRLWLKNVLHLSGGDAQIQEGIYTKLNFMANIIESNQYGAKVTTFRKNSTDPVTTALTEDILENINTGVSMLTFFGHSSAGTFDFSVEDVNNYENQGKHPVVFSMGCHSGDIHENLFSLSEEFILTPDLGAIAFVAASGNAFIDPLAAVGIGFYEGIGTEFYGKPIGLAMQKVLEENYNEIKGKYESGPKILSFFNTYVENITLHEQNTIHGDPAVSFFSATSPDYIVDFSSVQTMGVVGTTDEFTALEFDILNLGANRTGVTEMNNYIIHRYGSEVDTFYFTTAVPANSLRVQLQLPNAGKVALGKNSINIVLDHDNQIAEAPLPIAEDNNDLMQAWNTPEGFCFYVFDNNAQPIYPTEFGIVGKGDFDLIASSSNALATPVVYLIELDTTETFDSPFLKNTEITSSPAAIRWNPDVNYQNNTVYYWRVKPKNSQEAIWSNSSFIYLEDSKPGWNQSHYYQWVKDRYNNSSIDPVSRDFIYTENISEIRIKNGTAAKDVFIPEVIYQNNPTQYLRFNGEITSGVYMASFDGVTGAARVNYPDGAGNGLHGSVVDATWVENFVTFPYWTRTKEERGKVINFIENVVPSGDYIAMFTIQRSDLNAPDYKPELWAGDGTNGDMDLMTLLEGYGANRVRGLAAEAVPYILIFKKDDPSFTPIEVVATTAATRIETAFKIVGRWHEGEIGSTTIGPAQSWDKLLWNIDEINLAEDKYQLDISGCDEDGTETVLFENVDEFEFDLSSVDAEQFPYLKLNLFSTDSTSRTAPQMEYWRILFSGVPEAILDVNQKLVYDSDSMGMGDLFKFQTVATNVTDVDMDSLSVEYTITDSQNKVTVFSDRLAPLKANESLDLDFQLETLDYLGINEFKVEINPNEEQKEQHYYNNLGLRTFRVGGDNSNPLLDVTFDGVRIMNGDLVSPSPVITAMLKDDNTNLPITDINVFELSLQMVPGESIPIVLTADNVTFYPADSTNGYCASIEFTPEPALESGEYVLTVQGSDASGNLSGDNGMQIEFVVERESKISNVLPYPNPFSSHTQFVFTLTGMQVPDVFTIQIYTLSGKVVKEITKEELGPLRIGVNRTEYRWNGTDDFGNRLANGVYLYRVITSEVEGEKVRQYDNEDIDGFFKKGFGKLVIMR